MSAPSRHSRRGLTQTGEFQIEVIVSDGADRSATVFSVEVTNAEPTLNIENQVAAAGVPLMLELPTVDADGQVVEYTVEVIGDELATLDADHGFWSDGDFYTNYLGQNERWIRDANNDWYYLLPDGDLYRWEGSFAASTLVADLSSDIYHDPSRLTDPQPTAVIATVENGVLIIASAEGDAGDVTIRLTASDGFGSVATTFVVSRVSSSDVDEAFAALSDGELLTV